MSTLPMSNARREKQKKDRATAIVTAASTGDDDARRKAVMNVVQVWLDRLQLISTITTFVAGIDSTILSFAISLTHSAEIDPNDWSNTVRVLNASLTGALIFHICAAITSFTASFVLIRYRLIDMKDHMPPRPSTTSASTVVGGSAPTSSLEKARMARFESAPALEATHSKDSTSATHVNPPPLSRHGTRKDLLDLFTGFTDTVSELEGRVFIHQVQPFSFSHCFRRPDTNNGMHLEPPIRMLSACHTLSATMALLGFVLALVGILTFAWTALPTGVSVFASACLAICLGSVFLVANFT